MWAFMATFSPFRSEFSHQRYPGALYETKSSDRLQLHLEDEKMVAIALRGRDGVVSMSTVITVETIGRR
jgi:hypothetical protein